MRPKGPPVVYWLGTRAGGERSAGLLYLLRMTGGAERSARMVEAVYRKSIFYKNIIFSIMS